LISLFKIIVNYLYIYIHVYHILLSLTCCISYYCVICRNNYAAFLYARLETGRIM
jgi:hypothetical protein